MGALKNKGVDDENICTQTNFQRPFRFCILEHRGIVAPVIIESTGTVTISQDEGAALICIAQGCPAPEYRYVDIDKTCFYLFTIFCK